MSEGSPFGKILIGNLVALLLYAAGFKLYAVYGEPGRSGDADGFYVVMMLLFLIGHVVGALVLAAGLGLAGKRDPALAFLASAPLVLLVGAGVCLAGAANGIH